MMKSVNLLTLLLLGVLGCSETGPAGVEWANESVDSQEGAATLAKRPFWANVNTSFNLGFFADMTKPSWVGTVTSEGSEYGIVFYSLGAEYRGQAFHFLERVEIYTWVDFDFETQTLTTGEPLMWGINRGVEPPNDHFAANGIVVEAFGHFSMWEGRHFHVGGEVAFHPDGYPLSAAGSFRLN